MVCSGVSTAHGPAITVSVSGPIGTPATRMTERSRRCSLLTSLYGTEIRTTSATPGSPARFSVAAKRSMSPLSPMMVRDSPRLTNASPPASRTTLTTCSTSDAEASATITTTICPASHPNACPAPAQLAKSLQGSDVARVPCLPAGRLDHERDIGQRREQLAERPGADLAGADRLVPVAPGSAAEQRVVGVHQPHRGPRHAASAGRALAGRSAGRPAELVEHGRHPAGCGQVVAGREQVAGVQAEACLGVMLHRGQVVSRVAGPGAEHLSLAGHRLEQQVGVVVA